MADPSAVAVPVGRGELVLTVWGSEAGLPLVFLHGLNAYSNALALNEAADVLSGEYGRRLIAPDAPGFGRSPPRSDAIAPAPLAQLYLSALDEIGIFAGSLVGFSWGAAVAVVTAIAAPDRVPAVVLVDGAYWTLRESPVFGRFVAEGDGALERFALDEWDELVWESEDAWLAWLADALGTELRPSVRRTALAAVTDRDGAVRPHVTAQTYATALHELFHWDFEGALRRLGQSKVRVLLLAAYDDTSFGEMRKSAIPRFRRLVPAAEVVEIEGPHDLFLDDAHSVARQIGEWLGSD